ncbi:unnamed protein product [Caenorhabditis angaria]|uniref:Uncharacterized protein n=1 Tax=Caenorhabditis angaria TaxID=860376 RepID=A0A9P1J4F1_9PELO|nr:unnamed protein product [Caenorhabditis angaria]
MINVNFKFQNVKEEDESGEDSDESEEVDTDGDSDDEGESDDSEDIESDDEDEKEEQEESNDESENEENETDDENESDDSSIEILENDEDPEDDEEEEDDLEEDSDDEENEEEQEEEEGDSRVARSRRVPPASNDQVPTTSTNRKRKRSPSIEIVEEQSTPRVHQSTSDAPKRARGLANEDDGSAKSDADEDGEEAEEISDNSDESDDSNDEEDEEDEDLIDENYIRRFLNHAIQRNPQVYGNIPNVSDFINYTMNYIRSNQELLNDLTNSDQRLFTWYNNEFLIGSQNWMEFTNNPDSFEDLHRNQFEHSIEDDGTFVSVPLDPMPVLFPSAIQARLIERSREQHDWIVDHREAQYLMVLQRGREIERRGEEVRNLMRRNAELLEEINESRRQ